MACMEHHCGTCNHRDFDNRIWKRCPKCGSADVTNCFDELPESFYDEPEMDDETQ